MARSRDGDARLADGESLGFEFKRHGENGTTVEAKIGVDLKDGCVVLADQRADRPAGFLVAVQGCRQGKFRRLGACLGGAQLHAHRRLARRLNQRRRLERDLAQDEIAIWTAPRPHFRQRLVRQRFDAQRLDLSLHRMRDERVDLVLFRFAARQQRGIGLFL